MMFLYLPLSANVAPPVTFPPPAPDVPIILRKADNKYKPSVKLNYCDLFSLNHIFNSKYHKHHATMYSFLILFGTALIGPFYECTLISFK